MNMHQPLYTHIANSKWIVQGFNSCLNYISHGLYSALIDNYTHVGYGYTEHFYLFDHDYLEYHYLEADFSHVGKAFFTKFDQEPHYYDDLVQKDKELIKHCYQAFDKAERTDYDQLSKEETHTLYQQVWESYHQTVGIGHIIEGVTYILEPLLQEQLSKATNIDQQSKGFKQLMANLLEPAKPSFASEEQLSLLRIIKAIRDAAADPNHLPQPLRQQLEKHQKTFFYHQVNYYDADILPLKTYIDEIKKLLGSKADIDKLIAQEQERYEHNNKQRAELIKKYQLTGKTLQLINLAVDLLHWQDERKKHILTGTYYLNQTLNALARKYSIDHEHLKRYAPFELTIEKLDDFDIDEAKKRAEGMALYAKREEGLLEVVIITGKELDELKEGIKTRTKTEEDLHGATASLGTATGTVRICKTKKDIEQFKDGEILVAAMTRPEYLPAMKKAAAIVTDEGGITCHAAIVSRELGIPCIIGTKHATTTFNTGDEIEVRANHGWVQLTTRN